MYLKLTASFLAAAMVTAPLSLPAYAEGSQFTARSAMPSPFLGEGNAVFYQPCGRLDAIPDSLLNLVSSDDVTAWLAFHEAFHTGISTTLSEYPNIYSFIQAFSLKDVSAALNGILTEEEQTLVLSGTEEEVLAYFASAYTIVLGDRFYSPEWVYENSETDYADAGITPERLAEQFSYYRLLHFTEEAAAAFAEKLQGYTKLSPELNGYQELIVSGDVTQDGSIDAADAALLQQYLHGIAPFSKAKWAAADMDANGVVDVVDLTLLKRAALAAHPEKQTVSLPVPEYCQHPAYPTGCESAALYILLKYYGTDVTMEQIVNALPKGPKPYTSGGVTYGANPEREFVGDPRDSASFGVFNRPLASTAALFRSGVLTKTGASLTEVLSLLNEGSPVIVWYTTNPEAGIVYRRQWYDYQTGELIRWPGGEHAVVICGHDDVNLTYRDPNTGGSQTMAQAEFQKIFDELGGRIVYYKE